jgi:predicted dehydrogenase
MLPLSEVRLVEMGWYPLAFADQVCRRPVARVFARAGAYLFPAQRDLNVEDFATVSLETAGGPLVTFSVGRTGSRSAVTGSRLAVRAIGERGTLVVDGGRPTLTMYGGAPGAAGSRSPAPESAGLDRLVRDFVATLDGAPPRHHTAQQSAPLVAVLAAAYESIASGRAVAPRTVALPVTPDSGGA